MSSHGPVRKVSEDDIKRMAREAESENLRLHPPLRKPCGWHLRRANILLGLVPLADLTLDEVVWHLTERVALASEI